MRVRWLYAVRRIPAPGEEGEGRILDLFPTQEEAHFHYPAPTLGTSKGIDSKPIPVIETGIGLEPL